MAGQLACRALERDRQSDTELAVELVASQPHQDRAEGPTGEVVTIPVLQVLNLPEANREPGYPQVLVMAAYIAQHTGDWAAVNEFCSRAAEADGRSPQAERRGGNGREAYVHSAELAGAAGQLGLAAIFLAYMESCAVLGGESSRAIPIADDSVALARRSGMPVRSCSGLCVGGTRSARRTGTSDRESGDRRRSGGRDLLGATDSHHGGSPPAGLGANSHVGDQDNASLAVERRTDADCAVPVAVRACDRRGPARGGGSAARRRIRRVSRREPVRSVGNHTGRGCAAFHLRPGSAA